MKPVLILLLSFSVAAFSQGIKNPYRFPAGVKTGDYSSTTVLVKVKESQVAALRTGILRAKTTNGSSTFQAKQLLPGKAIEKMRTRNAPYASKSGVAIERYAEIPVQGNNVEAFINQLYATGLFELVEPSWRQTVHLAPNDPQVSAQYYLNIIKAQDAWDLADGEGIVIGIVDSGGDLDHPDIAPKLFIDPVEPLDGIDNDGDGYIDNNRGWDFVGGDTLNINDPNFQGDNNPGNPTGGTGSHGTSVAGCAGAAVNNGNGIAGVGYKAKLMFTKHSADNQKTNRGSIYFGYAGLLYAASHGASVVNLS
ncbi:MAG: S8 family serine peptidase, partial [Bacteroidota bacterium]